MWDHNQIQQYNYHIKYSQVLAAELSIQPQLKDLIFAAKYLVANTTAGWSKHDSRIRDPSTKLCVMQ